MKKEIYFFIFCYLCQYSILLAQGDNFTKLRENMVHNQIKMRGIKNEKVLSALEKVERHKFVPTHLVNYAYDDSPLPIGYEQTISQPYIVGLMSALVEPQEDDAILEIGTGSGYQAAVLSLLCKKVYTIEIIPELAHSAEKILKESGYDNVFVKAGDGFLGWSEFAPFDKIMITASAPKVPEPLIEQLKEAGKIIMPLSEGYPQKLCIYTKKNGKLEKKYIADVIFVPMIGKVRQ
ncbi:MAG: protein-L-isoaspartate(D-aspartate) O-methyltransferase [Candidatus Omnitrophota bacterium]